MTTPKSAREWAEKSARDVSGLKIASAERVLERFFRVAVFQARDRAVAEVQDALADAVIKKEKQDFRHLDKLLSAALAQERERILRRVAACFCHDCNVGKWRTWVPGPEGVPGDWIHEGGDVCEISILWGPPPSPHENVVEWELYGEDGDR